MAKPEVKLPRADEQRLFSSVQEIEPSAVFQVLMTYPEARVLAGQMVMGRYAEVEDTFTKAAPSVAPKSPNKVANYAELETKVEELYQIGDTMNKKTKGSGDATLAYAKESLELQYDFRDGAALALQLMAGNKDAKYDGLRKAIEDGDNVTIEKFLQGGSEKGVLNGIAEKVGGHIITRPEALGVMAKVGMAMNREGRIDKSMADQLQTEIRDLYGKGDLILNGQLATVENYLYWATIEGKLVNAAGSPVTESPGGQDMVAELRKIIAENLLQRPEHKGKNIAEMMALLQQVGKDSDPAQAGGTVAALQAMESVPSPTSIDHAEIMQWTYRMMDVMAREPLFWAGTAWQQIGPFLERQVRQLYSAVPDYNVDDKGIRTLVSKEERMAKEIGLLQAIVACRMQEGAILHCDGDPSSYASYLPPPGKMTDYLWKRGQIETIETESPMIAQVREWLVKRAYGGGDLSTEVDKGLKSTDSMNIWAEKITRDIMRDNLGGKVSGELHNKILKEEVRTAIALFVVEDYAEWALWVNKVSTEQGGLAKVPWMIPENPKLPSAPGESSVWNQRVKDKSGQLTWVQIWGADFSGSKGSTCVQHPYCSFMRPVDLYRFKSSWNETVLGDLETNLKYLAVQKWAYKDDGTPSDNKIRSMLKPSLMSPKDFDRYQKMIGSWIGGTQADGLDNFKDWLKGAEQLKALLQTRTDALDLGGQVAGDIFYDKVLAFMGNRKSEFLKVLSFALSGGDTTWEIKEIQAARGEVLGTTGVGEFGQLFETISRINLHMRTEKFDKAVAMLLTGEPDPDRAPKLVNVKKGAIIGQGLLTALGDLSGSGGKRR